MKADWIPLSDAAIAVGINRERLLRLVQGGTIQGRLNVTGRWEVCRASLERFSKEANEAAARPAASR